MLTLNDILKVSTVLLCELITRGPVAWDYYAKKLSKMFTQGNTSRKY